MPNSQECIHCGQHVDWEGEGVVTDVLFVIEKQRFQSRMTKGIENAFNQYFNIQSKGPKIGQPIEFSIDFKPMSDEELNTAIKTIELPNTYGTFQPKAGGIYVNSEKNIEVLIHLVKNNQEKERVTYTVRVEFYEELNQKLTELKNFYDKNINNMKDIALKKGNFTCFVLSDNVELPIRLPFYDHQKWYEAHYQDIFGEGMKYNKSKDYPYSQFRKSCWVEFTANLEKCKITPKLSG